MDTIQPGQMLGPYRIINQIGKGGMATVYKAYQASVDRYVAVKVLPSQLAESKEFAARFQQEARFIARLEHPHILPVFDYGESDGVAYFVMRYLEAGTLKDKMVEGRPLPLKDIDKIFTQLAEALSYAHGRGIVHRDLKPANALIDSQGNIFLTDFGIAKLLESASPRLTQTDAILGTPAYISPEQAQSQPVDQRSDIYSLGIILYEMVTGSVPFVAETPLAVLFKHISDPLPPPSLVKPDVPPSIEKVILKALEKNQQNRFATAAEFVAAWKDALEERETVAQETTLPPASPATASNQAQRRPAPATRTMSKAARPTGWIIGCLAVLCLVFSVGGIGVLALNLPIFSPSPATETPLPPIPSATPVPPTEVSLTGNVLLEDDFSVSQDAWGTLTDAESSIEYEGQALRMRNFTKNYVAWSTPNDLNYENVHLEITALNQDTDPGTAFGFICAQQTEEWSFYYVAITTAGDYAIIRATTGQSDVILTNDGNWGTSDLIPNQAPSYLIGADCGNGTLTLYVDGQQIASVSDNTYSSGRVGLFIWSGETVTSSVVTYDDFLIQSLE
jgi:serine/threonine protein kinase